MEKLPLLISRGIIVIPHQVVDLDVGRPKSIAAISQAQAINQKAPRLVVASQIDSQVDDPNPKQIYQVGTCCSIIGVVAANDGSLTLKIKGEKRVTICSVSEQKNEGNGIFFCVEYELMKDKYSNRATNISLAKKILKKIESNYKAENDHSKGESDWLIVFRKALNNVSKFADVVVGYISSKNVEVIKLQSFLAESSVAKRLAMANELLQEFAFSDKLGVSDSEQSDSKKNRAQEEESNDFDKNAEDLRLNKKLSENLSKQQREFYLRERLKLIKEELGELSSRDDDITKLQKKVSENPYPKHIKDKIMTEINRYEASGSSQEGSITRSYIEWLVELPWWQETKDVEDIRKVTRVLNKNHYGLTKVKERIIEYLAVKMRNKNLRGPILCLVGPPGVGKSSLARSIAEALNRKFIKISFGGMHDEGEIRGHRRTYVGAMPGRIIKGMRKAQVLNPLFLLDEIDKISSFGRQGDPASALLEILDPEQNDRFNDNYIEEDYDLTKVMFVATANYAENIPEALYDRLEIIELTSYTDTEKLAIAKQYLVPRALGDAKINKEDLIFQDEALNYIMKHFTREAGVRELERIIQQIVRKYVVDFQKTGKTKQVVDILLVKKYLKKELYDYTLKDENPIPGVVNGMAYTSTGGDLLPIEVTYSKKGKGELVITGNLRETMRESASVALGYVKANAEKFGINPEIFKEIDIQIHVPSGGVPKDGPSAGIALTTAIISALTSRKVDSTIAMTGEITLRGKVLVIGGVKEKTISAFRGGVRTIFMPEKDERYLDDIPKYILKELKIIFVKEYFDVYKSVFKTNSAQDVLK